MKIKRLPTGNVSIILETDEELKYLYAISNASYGEAEENGALLGICIDNSAHDIGFDLFFGLRKIVEN